jgi:hypothetical protein
MKRLFCLLFVLFLFPVVSLADLPDISGLSFDELVQLKDQINLAMWNSQQWQEVTVPAGVYTVGKDIPEGYWTIKSLPPKGYCGVVYFDKINEFGTDADSGFKGWHGILSASDDDNLHSIDLDMKSGMYFKCSGTVIFTPYSGKPDLGFK